MPQGFYAPITPIRSSWNETKLLMKGPLTDKAIARYAEKGWYSAEFREARRELLARKKAKREIREGNFLVQEDGRKVYSPR